VVLVLACALLLFVVFPWVEPHLPFSDVTVDGWPTGGRRRPGRARNLPIRAHLRECAPAGH
jgi:hypothetical protein